MRGQKIRQRELFDYERPIAQQSSILANSNRDPKKQKKPFTLEDFSFYMPREEKNLPSGAYGSAAMEAIKQGIYPSWALFCFADLKAGANPSYVPEMPILVAKDALLLHPVRNASGWSGMLIAAESASEQKRVFTDGKGNEWSLHVPFIGTKYVAQEDITLLPTQWATHMP